MRLEKRFSPAAERNGPYILEVLRAVLGSAPRVLEIGSGTGQHALYFTSHWPSLTWQPTEATVEGLVSIEAYGAEAISEGFRSPRRLDVLSDAWPDGSWDAVFAANVIHIAPAEVCEAIVQGSAEVVVQGGCLVLYGPFRFGGVLSPESNVAFDQHLRDQDPRWGIRDLEDVTRLALREGFGQPVVRALPANNHCVTFKRL